MKFKKFEVMFFVFLFFAISVASANAAVGYYVEQAPNPDMIDFHFASPIWSGGQQSLDWDFNGKPYLDKNLSPLLSQLASAKGLKRVYLTKYQMSILKNSHISRTEIGPVIMKVLQSHNGQLSPIVPKPNEIACTGGDENPKNVGTFKYAIDCPLNKNMIDFLLNVTLVPKGIQHFDSSFRYPEEPESPLMSCLRQIEGVNSIFLSENEISIAKAPAYEWQVIKPKIVAEVENYFKNTKFSGKQVSITLPRWGERIKVKIKQVEIKGLGTVYSISSTDEIESAPALPRNRRGDIRRLA
jgi:hypothetical protein